MLMMIDQIVIGRMTRPPRTSVSLPIAGVAVQWFRSQY